MPHRQLLASVRIARKHPNAPIYEGHAVAVSVSIGLSDDWASTPLEGEQRLVYDVQTAQEDWIVLGRKKGFFVAKVCSASIFRVACYVGMTLMAYW